MGFSMNIYHPSTGYPLETPPELGFRDLDRLHGDSPRPQGKGPGQRLLKGFPEQPAFHNWESVRVNDSQQRRCMKD